MSTTLETESHDRTSSAAGSTPPTGRTRSRAARLSTMLVVLFATATAALLAFAGPADAGEFKSFSSKYINGVCQNATIDADCYHYVGTYTTHQGCFNKVAAIIGVNPKTDSGKFQVNNTNWYCPAKPPSGNYTLYVYQSSPKCKVGLPFSQCPKP